MRSFTTVLSMCLAQGKLLFWVLIWFFWLFFVLEFLAGEEGVVHLCQSFQVGIGKNLSVLIRNVRSRRLCTVISRSIINRDLFIFR